MEKAFNSYFEAAIQELIDQKEYCAVSIPTQGYFWCEIDFLEDYERAKRELPN